MASMSQRVAGDLAPVVSAVCVVSEARPRRGRVFRMMALAVDGRVRGQGLATEAMARMKAELLLVAGPRFELRADLASCMKKGGAKFYASQGWSGEGGIWAWRSEATGVEGALRLLASGEALEQMLQVCEQDMSVTDEAMSDLRGVGQTTSKRKRGEELAHQHVRHSLWEQDSLEAYNELLFGCLDEEVEALQQYKAQYDEARRLSDGSDSCWSHSGSDSDSEAVPEVDIEPLPMGGAGEGGSQRGKVEGADCEQTGERGKVVEPAQQPVRHSLWEQSSLEAYNELLFGCLDGEVAALQQRKAEYDEARRQSDGSDTSGDCSDDDSGSVAELVVEGRQGPLQPLLGKRVQRVESALQPGGLALKRRACQGPTISTIQME